MVVLGDLKIIVYSISSLHQLSQNYYCPVSLRSRTWEMELVTYPGFMEGRHAGSLQKTGNRHADPSFVSLQVLEWFAWCRSPRNCISQSKTVSEQSLQYLSAAAVPSQDWPGPGPPFFSAQWDHFFSPRNAAVTQDSSTDTKVAGGGSRRQN